MNDDDDDTKELVRKANRLVGDLRAKDVYSSSACIAYTILNKIHDEEVAKAHPAIKPRDWAISCISQAYAALKEAGVVAAKGEDKGMMNDYDYIKTLECKADLLVRALRVLGVADTPHASLAINYFSLATDYLKLRSENQPPRSDSIALLIGSIGLSTAVLRCELSAIEELKTVFKNSRGL